MQNNNLKVVLTADITDAPFKCIFCKKIFVSEGHLSRHKTRRHNYPAVVFEKPIPKQKRPLIIQKHPQPAFESFSPATSLPKNETLLPPSNNGVLVPPITASEASLSPQTAVPNSPPLSILPFKISQNAEPICSPTVNGQTPYRTNVTLIPPPHTQRNEILCTTSTSRDNASSRLENILSVMEQREKDVINEAVQNLFINNNNQLSRTDKINYLLNQSVEFSPRTETNVNTHSYSKAVQTFQLIEKKQTKEIDTQTDLPLTNERSLILKTDNNDVEAFFVDANVDKLFVVDKSPSEFQPPMLKSAPKPTKRVNLPVEKYERPSNMQQTYNQLAKDLRLYYDLKHPPPDETSESPTSTETDLKIKDEADGNPQTDSLGQPLTTDFIENQAIEYCSNSNKLSSKRQFNYNIKCCSCAVEENPKDNPKQALIDEQSTTICHENTSNEKFQSTENKSYSDDFINESIKDEAEDNPETKSFCRPLITDYIENQAIEYCSNSNKLSSKRSKENLDDESNLTCPTVSDSSDLKEISTDSQIPRLASVNENSSSDESITPRSYIDKCISSQLRSLGLDPEWNSLPDTVATKSVEMLKARIQAKKQTQNYCQIRKSITLEVENIIQQNYKMKIT